LQDSGYYSVWFLLQWNPCLSYVETDLVGNNHNSCFLYDTCAGDGGYSICFPTTGNEVLHHNRTSYWLHGWALSGKHFCFYGLNEMLRCLQWLWKIYIQCERLNHVVSTSSFTVLYWILVQVEWNVSSHLEIETRSLYCKIYITKNGTKL